MAPAGIIDRSRRLVCIQGWVVNRMQRIKDHWLSTLVLSIAALVVFLGTVAGAINSLFDLVQRVELTDEDGTLFRSGVRIISWLSLELPVPVWVTLPLFLVSGGAAYLLLRQRTHIAALSQELNRLKHPAAVELSSTEERVLFWVKKFYDRTSTGYGPTPADIAKVADMPLSSVEAVMDVLKQARLVRLKKLKSDPLDLTAEGRAYFKPLEVRERYDAFEISLHNRRI